MLALRMTLRWMVTFLASTLTAHPSISTESRTWFGVRNTMAVAPSGQGRVVNETPAGTPVVVVPGHGAPGVVAGRAAAGDVVGAVTGFAEGSGVVAPHAARKRQAASATPDQSTRASLVHPVRYDWVNPPLSVDLMSASVPCQTLFCA